MPTRSPSRLRLPCGWPRTVKSALLHVVALARVAVLDVRAGFENGRLARARKAAEIDRLRSRIATLEEELRIKDARMAAIPAAKRPHYAPPERLAILTLRAATGWNVAETARRFLVTPATIAFWMRRLDESGEDALVALQEPVNRFPDFVAVVVRQLKAALPSMGKVRIAQLLARAGILLAPATVRRMLERKSTLSPEPRPSETSAADYVESDRAKRVVSARHPQHLWHIDLTVLPTSLGFWVPWWPFSLGLRWPFCAWVGVVLDHFSRGVVAKRAFCKEPTAEEICALLDRAVENAGRAPRHIVSDQGPQFGEKYRAWCQRRGVRPRFGAIGEHGSIAIIERFFRSMKDECFRRIIVPLSLEGIEAELDAYVRWYMTARPHQGIGGWTPEERLCAGKRLKAKRPVWETRPRLSARSRRSRARVRGDPTLCKRPRLVRGVELRISKLDGRKHLPLVELRRAA